MSNLICADKPLVFSGSLAAALKSSDAAIVLQQIHYWLGKKSGKIIDGIRWIHNRYSDWLEQFPWLTEWKLRKIMYHLRDLQIIKFEQKEVKQYKRRGWYTIDYERLNALQRSMCGMLTPPTGDFQNIEMCNVHTSKQKNSISKELLTTNTHPPHPAAVTEKNYEEKKEAGQAVMMSETPEATVQTDLEPKETTNLNGDKFSAYAQQEEKLNLIKAVGIRLNGQLKILVKNFTLEAVKNAIAYYQQTKTSKEAKGKTIERPAGWLTDCLRQCWWDIAPEKSQQQAEFDQWYEKAIAQGLVEDLPKSWLSQDRFGQYLVRQRKPGLYGAPYTLIAWQELRDTTTEPKEAKENTDNDDFEEFD